MQGLHACHALLAGHALHAPHIFQFCMQCMPTTHAWTRKIAGQCTHCHRTNRKTSAVSVTHRCKRSTDQEQLGCHDHPIARRSRHESKRVTVRLDQIVKEVEATLLGSQLTKGGNIGFSNLRCAHRTNCSTVASGPAQPSANAPPLRGWKERANLNEAGKTACRFRNFLMFAPGALQ